ncbi:hypothetical protein [uncultured Arthrobacter sp.]|uniref:hypothetical protein n=1 Tax=uncultured Arthrobacter sp. TaxID=114050 RepID=UPI00260477C0|nr:hypothetical protein [uncultured Arthrobacter sp.]
MAAGTGLLSMAAAMPAAASAGTAPTPGGGSDSQNHRDAVMGDHHPGMAQMQELMKDGNPGMMRMHENMMGPAAGMPTQGVAGSVEGELR